MASLNKVMLIGRLGKDPELRSTPTGREVATFSIATSEKYKNKQTNDWEEKTEWHNIVFWDRQATLAGQYLTKGSSVYIEGRLQTRKWQDKNGNDRYTTEIVGNSLEFLSSKGDGARSNATNVIHESTTTSTSHHEEGPLEEDDIPF